MFKRIIPGLMCLSLLACGPATDRSVEATESVEMADLILIGEHIITMDESEVDAVAVIGDSIVATGSVNDILTLRGDHTRVVELGEKALLPGFIDAHGHLAVVARLIEFINVSSPPIGSVKNIGDIQKILRNAITEKNIPPGKWVVGYGYDESLLETQQHPNRKDLDTVSSEHPVMLLHVSLHLVVANSMALAEYGVDADTPQPAGGRIRKWADSSEPNGVLEETAAQPFMFGLQTSSNEGLTGKFRRALELYASAGITTAQDGASVFSDVTVMRAAAAESPLPIDLVAYYHAMILSDEQRADLVAEPYVNGFRVGGAKLVLDGSIQGKTGFLTDPYVEPPEGKDANYLAYPMISAEIFQKVLDPLLERKVPVLIHANGDASIDMMIDGIAKSFANKEMPDHRSVIIHAQMIREDQLDRLPKLGILPSYFSAHPYFWGDWHGQILGEERAARISPLRSTIKRGIPFTIHNDAPVVPSDIMRLIWITVNRKTRSGHVLGPDQRVTVMEALHAVTQGAAYQYFEEDKKGSITTGKQADFVILATNPLEVELDAIKDIQIVETISRGRVVYTIQAQI